MKQLIKRIFAMLLTLIITGISILPVLANSARTYWRGVDAMGATVMEEICPVEVERELLTFDLTELYQHSYETKEEFLSYSGKVSAEYTFHNPADYTVTAKLFFPFGAIGFGTYEDENGIDRSNIDIGKYGITVNGTEIEKRVRHTLDTRTRLTVLEQIPWLSDAYITDDFYKPDTMVMKYTYEVKGIDEKQYPSTVVSFTWAVGDGSTKLCVTPSSATYSAESGEVTFEVRSRRFDVYMIGAPLATPLQMKCFVSDNGKLGEEIPATISGVRFEYPDLEKHLLRGWSEDTGVSRIDWYNAKLTLLKGDLTGEQRHYFSTSGEKALAMLTSDEEGYSFSTKEFLSNLMQWYEYEITVPAKSRIVNKVTAPIYPSIDRAYQPAIYEYTYLLSPAGTWKHFGELEIVINTPYYMIENTLDGFEKTPNGYVLRRTGLPEGELLFTLSTSEDPKIPKKSLFDQIKEFLHHVSGWFYLLVIGMILILVSIIVLVVYLCKKAKAKKQKE